MPSASTTRAISASPKHPASSRQPRRSRSASDPQPSPPARSRRHRTRLRSASARRTSATPSIRHPASSPSSQARPRSSAHYAKTTTYRCRSASARRAFGIQPPRLRSISARNCSFRFLPCSHSKLQCKAPASRLYRLASTRSAEHGARPRTPRFPSGLPASAYSAALSVVGRRPRRPATRPCAHTPSTATTLPRFSTDA